MPPTPTPRARPAADRGSRRVWRRRAHVRRLGIVGAVITVCPSPRQQEVAHALTDAGADIVVGSHAHQLQGGGRFNTSFVDYGLGNFDFYNEVGEYERSGVLVVTATGRDIDSYQWVPARIRGGVATPLPAGAESDAELAHWNELRACTGLAP